MQSNNWLTRQILWLALLCACIGGARAHAQSATPTPGITSRITLTSGPSPSPAVIGNRITCQWSAEVIGTPHERAECLTEKATYTWSVDALTLTLENGDVIAKPTNAVTLNATGATATTVFVGDAEGLWTLVVRVKISYTGTECGGAWNNGDGITGTATVAVQGFVLHPTESDFEGGVTRVLLTKQRADSYYTPNKTTRADTPAQTHDHQVQITAHFPAAAVGAAVYFRVIDPDDLSPYEPDVDPDDNTDGNGNHLAPSLSASSATATLATINTNEVAAAEVTLNVTGASGNNYIVQASTNALFPVESTKSTALMVAWKRCYLEIDNMYQKGATVTADTPIAKGQETVLAVDNTDDFTAQKGTTAGSSIVIFTRDAFTVPGSVPVQTSRTIAREVLDKTATSITVSKIGVPLPQWSGIRLVDNPSIYVVSTSLLEAGFGAFTDGSDGGAFVEFIRPIQGSRTVPRHSGFDTENTYQQYARYWFVNGNNQVQNNTFQLLAAEKMTDEAGTAGITDSDHNLSAVFAQDSAGPPNFVFIEKSETAVHELGHQFQLGHDSADAPNINIPPNDQCVMSYTRVRDNAVVDFDLFHIEQIRAQNDPQ